MEQMSVPSIIPLQTKYYMYSTGVMVVNSLLTSLSFFHAPEIDLRFDLDTHPVGASGTSNRDDTCLNMWNMASLKKYHPWYSRRIALHYHLKGMGKDAEYEVRIEEMTQIFRSIQETRYALHQFTIFPV